MSSRDCCCRSLKNQAPRNLLMVFQARWFFSAVFLSPAVHTSCGERGERQAGGWGGGAHFGRSWPGDCCGQPRGRTPPPGPRDAGDPAVAAEADGMKPRPAGFVDNKLKQRVTQVGLAGVRARCPRAAPPWTGLAATTPGGAVGSAPPPPAVPGLRSRWGAGCLGPAGAGGRSPGPAHRSADQEGERRRPLS